VKEDLMAKKILPGILFEQAVHRIQQRMDADSKVTHNETLQDRVGNKRQYDVVIRGAIDGRPILGIMECKDYASRKTGPEAIDGFANKIRNVGADFGIIVSRRGFTKAALRLARFENIRCYSVASKEFESGASFGQYIYGIARNWMDVELKIDFEAPSPGTADPKRILFKGKPIGNWLQYELFNEHSSKEPGLYWLRLTFPSAIPVEMDGNVFRMKGISYSGVLTHSRKRLFVGWTGDAFYEWSRETLRIPANVPIMTSAIEPRMNLWEDYDGPIPMSVQGNGVLLLADGSRQLPEGAPIPDLLAFNPLYEFLRRID
jgi:hypothetical protein